MGGYVVAQLVKAMTKKRIHVDGAKVLVMGLAFKENCPDLRNTRVIDIVNELKEYNCEVEVFDPWADAKEAEHEYGITPIVGSALQPSTYDAIILAVGHSEFKQMGAKKIRTLGKDSHILYDIKYLLDATESDLRL
jgi:UDP-N-acetyl-D-galactosamine dehydrogenase